MSCMQFLCPRTSCCLQCFSPHPSPESIVQVSAENYLESRGVLILNRIRSACSGAENLKGEYLPTQNKIPLLGRSLVMIISCQVTNYFKNLMAYNNSDPSSHRHVIWGGLGGSSSALPGSRQRGSVREPYPNLQDAPLVSWDLGGGGGEAISASFYTGLPWDACNMKVGFKECAGISFVF